MGGRGNGRGWCGKAWRCGVCGQRTGALCKAGGVTGGHGPRRAGGRGGGMGAGRRGAVCGRRRIWRDAVCWSGVRSASGAWGARRGRTGWWSLCATSARARIRICRGMVSLSRHAGSGEICCGVRGGVGGAPRRRFHANIDAHDRPDLRHGPVGVWRPGIFSARVGVGGGCAGLAKGRAIRSSGPVHNGVSTAAPLKSRTLVTPVSFAVVIILQYCSEM